MTDGGDNSPPTRAMFTTRPPARDRVEHNGHSDRSLLHPGDHPGNHSGSQPGNQPGDEPLPVPGWAASGWAGPGSAPAGRRLRPVLAVLAVGLLLGALVGIGFGVVLGGRSTAGVLVQLAPAADPSLAALQANTQSDSAVTSFTAAEFAYLSGPGFATAVAEKLGEQSTPPTVDVTKVGTSSVVSFTASAATPDAALRTVQAAVDVYSTRRTEQFKKTITDSLASVDRTLREVGNPPPAGQNATEPSRVERLLALRADLLLLSFRESAPVQILEAPAVQKPSAAPYWLLPAVLGAVLGGLVALGAHGLWRSRTSSILAPADATAVADRILYPEIALGRDWATRSLQVIRDRDRYASRLLVTQLAGRRSMSGRIVAVVGASGRSASRAVATMIAVGAAEQTPTLLAEARSPAEQHPLLGAGVGPFDDQRTISLPPPPLPSPRPRPGTEPAAPERVNTHVPGLEILTAAPPSRSHPGSGKRWLELIAEAKAYGRCVVVDVADHTDIVRLLPSPVEPVIVLGVGVDTIPHSAAIASALRSTPGRLVGVVTRLPWHVQLRKRRGTATVDG